MCLNLLYSRSCYNAKLCVLIVFSLIVSGCHYNADKHSVRFESRDYDVVLPDDDFSAYITASSAQIEQAIQLRLAEDPQAYRYDWDIDALVQQAAPFLIEPDVADGQLGFLLMHGINETPGKMRDLADALHKQYPNAIIYAPMMSGHGTLPGDMLSASYHDWVLMSHHAYQLLAAKVDHVVLVGFSTGAVLALELMQDNSADQVSGLILVAPAVSIKSWVPLSRWLRKLRPFVRRYHDDTAIKYNSVTFESAYQVMLLSRSLDWKHLLEVPVLVFMADHDSVLDTQSNIAYLKQVMKHPKSKVMIMGKAKNAKNYDLASVAFIEGDEHFKSYNMIDIDHMGLLVKPENPLLGYHGLYPDCRFHLTQKSIDTCRESQSTGSYGPVSYGVMLWGPRDYRISSFNPLFNTMVEQMTQFISEDVMHQ